MANTQQTNTRVPVTTTVATEICPVLVEHFTVPGASRLSGVDRKQSSEVLSDGEIMFSETPTSLEEGIGHSNEDFQATTDCSQSLNADVSDAQQALLSTRSDMSDSSPVICMCCSHYRGLLGYWQVFSVNLSESIYLIPLLFVLLALPISTGFMGAKYMDKCPMSVPTPLLLFMMGILGTIINLCSMAIILSKRFMPTNGNCTQPKSVVVVGCVVVFLFYCTELLCFLGNSPSFEHGTENYCDKTFYNFTYCLNWGVFGLTLLLLLLYVPKLMKLYEYCSYRERLDSQA